MRLFDALRSKPAGNNRGAEGVKPKGTQDGRAVETATPAKRRGLSSIVHFFRTRLAEKSSTTNGPRATPETRHSAKLVDSILKSAAAPFNKMEAHSSVVLRPTMTTENFDAVRANAIDFVEALLPMGQHGANLVASTLDAYFSKEAAGRGFQPPRLAALSALSDALQNSADKENPVVAKLSHYVKEQFLAQFGQPRGGFAWDKPGIKEWQKLVEAATAFNVDPAYLREIQAKASERIAEIRRDQQSTLAG